LHKVAISGQLSIFEKNKVRRILNLLFIFIPIYSFGQFTSIPTKDAETILLDTVLKVDSANKYELYTRAKIWVSDYFKSANAVIDLDDKDNGIIIGKGKSKIEVPTAVGQPFQTNCHYTFKLSFKDEKVKVEVYDFSYKVDHAYYSNGYLVPETETFPKTWFLPKIGKKMVNTCQGYRDETLRVINSLFSTFKVSINTPIEKSDW
jgi:hypothetical protein